MGTAPDTLVIAPSHVVAISDSWRIQDVAFSPDGRSLYVQYFDQSLNLWSVAVHFWAYLLGAVVGAVAIVCLIALVRIRRRARVVGHRHCRKCNYDLSGTGDRPCAECGVDPTKRRPVIGRSMGRRIAPWLAALLIGSVGYGSLFIFRGRWERWASSLMHWEWAAAREAAQTGRAPWLNGFLRYANKVVEFDPATGRLLRTIAYSGSAFEGPFALTADGSAMVIQGMSGELLAIDPRTSRVIDRAPRPDGVLATSSPYSPGWRHVAGFTADSKAAFVQFYDDKTAENTLYRWDLRAHTLTSLLKLSAATSLTKTTAVASVRTGVVRKFYVLDGTAPLLIAEVPDGFAEGLTYGASSGIVIRNVDEGCREVRTMTDGFWSNARPHVDVQRGAIFIRLWGHADIGMYNLASGEEIGSMNAPGFMGTMSNGLEFYPPKGLLFVAGSNPCEITVRDTAAKSWIARLQFPSDGLPPNEFAVSADGRRVAGHYTDTGPKNRAFNTPRTPAGAAAVAAGFREKLVIFDLPAPAATPKADEMKKDEGAKAPAVP